MSLKLNRWSVAVGYVLFIYVTLGFVPAPLRFLRANEFLRLTIAILYFGCLFGILFFLIRQRVTEAWRYVVVIGIFILYAVLSLKIPYPEEQIHFLEYGLVGILFARALKQHIKQSWFIFFYAFCLASICGVIDEILQGLLPNRHYDLRDIFLNMGSAILGLLIYRAFPPQNKHST